MGYKMKGPTFFNKKSPFKNTEDDVLTKNIKDTSQPGDEEIRAKVKKKGPATVENKKKTKTEIETDRKNKKIQAENNKAKDAEAASKSFKTKRLEEKQAKLQEKHSKLSEKKGLLGKIRTRMNERRQDRMAEKVAASQAHDAMSPEEKAAMRAEKRAIKMKMVMSGLDQSLNAGSYGYSSKSDYSFLTDRYKKKD